MSIPLTGHAPTGNVIHLADRRPAPEPSTETTRLRSGDLTIRFARLMAAYPDLHDLAKQYVAALEVASLGNPL